MPIFNMFEPDFARQTPAVANLQWGPRRIARAREAAPRPHAPSILPPRGLNLCAHMACSLERCRVPDASKTGTGVDGTGHDDLCKQVLVLGVLSK